MRVHTRPSYERKSEAELRGMYPLANQRLSVATSLLELMSKPKADAMSRQATVAVAIAADDAPSASTTAIPIRAIPNMRLSFAPLPIATTRSAPSRAT